MILSDDRHIRRDRDHFEFVNLRKFRCFRLCRTRHTGEFFVKTEVVLKGNVGKSLALLLDLHALFGFKRLMQAFAESATLAQTPRKFIHDYDLSVAHDVVYVLFKKIVRLKRLIKIVAKHGIFETIEVIDVKKLLGF